MNALPAEHVGTVTIPTLLTVPQVADLLQVSNRHVYDLIYRSELPSFKIGSSRRVSREDLADYISAGRRA